MKAKLYIVSIVLLSFLLPLAGCQAPEAAFADSAPEASSHQASNQVTVINPGEVAQSFYNDYIAYFGFPDGQNFRSPLGDKIYRDSPYVTEGFVRQVEEILASFDGQSGYDPILCAQNVPTEISAEVTFISGGSASVLMRSDLLFDHAFTVELVNQGESWQIERVICSMSPTGTAHAFYTWYLGYITAGASEGRSPDQMRNPLVDGAYRQSPFLTRTLVEKVNALMSSFDKGGYDPFLLAQDIPQSFEVQAGPAENSVILIEQFGPGSSIEVLVSMEMENGRWFIDDIARVED